MKFAIEKKIDGLGRIVLPKNIRACYGIGLEETLRLIPTDSGILITKKDSSNLENENTNASMLKENHETQ